MELVTLPASVVFAGPDTKELVVAFRVSDRMSDVAVEVDEAPDGVTVRVEAKLDAPSEASCGWFPFLTHTSARVPLAERLGLRPVWTRRSSSFC